ncbi:MAG: DUF2723 domain-containing protein [Candidatus Latescibacterota bacterium]|nr:MAG: DUF2723 domain-containing protein [Candidatus Latescibacterota bacterium]
MAKIKNDPGAGQDPLIRPPGSTTAPPGQRLFYGGAVLVFMASLVIYLATMGRSAAFWDPGEFIASAYILGIPHSPGTPLYVILGRVFTLLPLPLTVAGKVNFISVLFGAGGVAVVYILIVRFLDSIQGKSETTLDTAVKVGGGLVGALFLAFSDTYWINAIEAEVYSLSAFFMGFMTWLALKWSDNPTGEKSAPLIWLLFYLLALSVGFHLGTVLAFSGIFFLVLMTRKKTFTDIEFIVASFGMAIFLADATIYRNGTFTAVLLVVFLALLLWLTVSRKSPFALICTLLFVLGISVHLYMLIRSGHNPAIDEGDPETWRALYFALRREQYPPPNMLIRKASFVFQLKHFNDYFQGQFQMAAAYIGSLNIGSVIPLALGIWGMVDHYAKNKKTFVVLFVTFAVTSLGLILFLNFSDTEVRERDYFYSPAFYYFAVFIGIGTASLVSELRKFAVDKGMSGSAPVIIPLVLLVAMPFVTAKHHYFAHDRSNNFICRKYAMNMLVTLEPNAIIFTNGDNDTFPLWYIQEVEKYRTDVRVVNLSLLNTAWYIKQLRDNEPQVEVNWNDQELEGLMPIRTKDGWVLIRDIAVQQILKHNARTRPIYFAVTIPPEIYAPYRDFLEMEGLAYRVVPRKGTNMVNAEVLEDNIWNKFDFGGILTADWKIDNSLYRPPYVRRLIQNYAAAFTQLGFVKGRENNFEDAVKNLEVALEISPDLEPALLWLGWYYLEMGDSVRAVSFYKEQIDRRPDRPDLLYRLAGVYERLGHLDSALIAVDELIKRDPDHREAVMSAVGMALRFEMIDSAKRYLENYLARHPNDAQMRGALEELSAGDRPGQLPDSTKARSDSTGG